MRKIEGIIPAVVTAYDDKGNLSEKRQEALYSHLIKNGVDGLFVGGSTGEWPLLTYDERIIETQIALDVADGKIPVIMHASSLLIDEIKRYIHWAEDHGVAALSVVMPYYFTYREDGLLAFFQQALANCSLPVLIYNIPGNVKNILTPTLMQNIADSIDCVVGLKDSSMDYLKLQEFMSAKYSRELIYFTGNDAQIIPALFAGATGAVSAAAGAFPAFVKEMHKAYLDKNYEKAMKMQQSILRYRQLVVSNPPMSVVKEALNYQGINVGKPRLPLNPLPLDKFQTLENLIMEGGLLK
mgnify:CR=1 FL=1